MGRTIATNNEQISGSFLPLLKHLPKHLLNHVFACLHIHCSRLAPGK
jgi:hypothetical protein